MRIAFLLALLLLAAMPDHLLGQGINSNTPADQFVGEVMDTFTKISSCRAQFSPREALISFGTGATTQRYEEPDRREPGITNHVQIWEYAGFVIKAQTHFTFFGPSTWLTELTVREPSELPGELAFGDSVASFAGQLAVSESTIRSGTLDLYEGRGVYVRFTVGEDDTVASLHLECIAD